MNAAKARELLERYNEGLCTEEEKYLVEQWLSSLEARELPQWNTSEKELYQQKLRTGIEQAINEGTGRKRLFPKVILRAAVLLLVTLLGVVTYYYFGVEPAETITEVAVKNDIDPGNDGAILTLANGEKLVLDSAGNGMLAVQSDVNIKSVNGQLIYEGGTSGGEATYNTVSTPRARQFKLQLSDGTKVWLNAGSHIKYPVSFGADSRKVEVSGEVFLEVSSIKNERNQKIPFFVDIVSDNKSVGLVEVTGTQFNVNAYSDDIPLKATLVEGGIRYRNGTTVKTLLPGQQVRLTENGNVNVLNNVNIDMEVAWKNGFFTYDQADIQLVMRQLERWYDITVEYKNGKIPDEKFWGDIERSSTLSEVLKILELSGVKFKIDGKKLIVTGS